MGVFNKKEEERILKKTLSIWVDDKEILTGKTEEVKALFVDNLAGKIKRSGVHSKIVKIPFFRT